MVEIFVDVVVEVDKLKVDGWWFVFFLFVNVVGNVCFVLVWIEDE